MTMKKMSYYFVLLLTALLPIFASAHVKWFVDSEKILEASQNNSTFYGWGSKEVIIWSLIVLVTVFIFSLIDRHTSNPNKLQEFGFRNEKIINRISQAVLGLFLVTVSLIWKIILVPEIHVENDLTTILVTLQISIGLMYMFDYKPKVASIGLIIFCLGLLFFGGIPTFLENSILFSLAVYFYLVNSQEGSREYNIRKNAVEIVRIGTGVSLITLAFTEKLIHPELSIDFLSVHHWNFMQSLFPWFTNNLFVLSTGFAEMIFGILFILGYITRTTTILIAIFFGISVTTMLLQFHQWEVEDLVVYSAAILFIFYGQGGTKFFNLIKEGSFWHKSIFGK